MAGSYKHKPVLIEEVISHLITRKDGIYIDCTAGEGGHSHAILKVIGENGRLVGIDRDADALAVARRRLRSYTNFIPVKDNFLNICKVIKKLNIEIGEIDGMLFDLGVSSFQLEDPQRGFAFKYEGPLDMRMDPQDTSYTAADLVNTLSFLELRELLKKYGEERYASRIARAVLRAREKGCLRTTTELAGIIERKTGRRGRVHPATRTFQALRIAVNNELENLEKGLGEAIGMLSTGGRICVISFHSLEDRIVKNVFRSSSLLNSLTRKPITPGEEEVKSNPRARSAKLRAAEKV